MSAAKIVIGLADGFAFADRLNTRRRIAYVDHVGSAHRVCVACADGSQRGEVFDDGDSHLACPLAWSPDGRTLYHSHDQIYAIDVASATARTVTHFPENELFGVYWHLKCSPDNQTLIFRHNPSPHHNPLTSYKVLPSRVCAATTSDGNVRILLEDIPDRRLWQFDCHWQQNLIVAVMIAKHPASELWRFDLDGKKPVLIATMPQVPDWPVISPDGTELAYSNRSGIYTLSIADRGSDQVASFGTSQAWSPDGKRIALMKGDYELWLADLTDGRQQRAVWVEGRDVSTAERKGSYACSPVWSSDGRFLWFRLTRTIRLTEPNDPDYVKRMQTAALLEIPESRREAMRKNSIESAYWDHTHQVGVVDFVESKVCLVDGYWRGVAWSPAED
jgi:Tol biopolymer transport system component